MTLLGKAVSAINKQKTKQNSLGIFRIISYYYPHAFQLSCFLSTTHNQMENVITQKKRMYYSCVCTEPGCPPAKILWFYIYIFSDYDPLYYTTWSPSVHGSQLGNRWSIHSSTNIDVNRKILIGVEFLRTYSTQTIKGL